MNPSYFSSDFLSSQKKTNKNKQIKYPKISIVMPSFNQAKFIEKSILSVLNQDYPNYQLIIIDGGSTDQTIDIIKKYNDKIFYWISEEDNGQSDALNKGFDRCNGDIYGWLNSDDIYLPNAFYNAANALGMNPQKKIVFGDWVSLDKEDNVFDLNHAFNFNLNHFKYEGFHLNAQSMFWDKEVHNRFSGFDINLYNTMDYQMILEFGINESENSFMRIPFALGGFRRYEGQKTAGMDSNVIKEHKLISEKYSYTDKYKFIGKIKRLIYRIRRSYWYTKRGGLSNLIYRIEKSYEVKH
ncbi:glycosyltransferase [Alphaproteobacteria bacterium]|nr:glycosyltransferase [Alphaproteobacteria bacterium]